MQRDGRDATLYGLRRMRIVRNATRLARLCGIMIVWNAECNEMDKILLCMDCAECGLCGMRRDWRDNAEC